MNMNKLLLLFFEGAICATAISMDGAGNETDQANLMHGAIWNKDEELVQHFLANGADPNGRMADWTHLRFAVYVDHEGIVRALLAAPGIDPNLTPSIESPLCQATYRGNGRIVRMLLDAPGIDPNGSWFDIDSPLFAAVQYGHTGIVRMLLNAPGINPNCDRNDHDQSPLMRAVLRGHEDIVRMLLDAPGIDPNGCPTDFESPLLAAVRAGLVDIVRNLLNAPGINPNCRGKATGDLLWRYSGNVAIGPKTIESTVMFLDSGAVIKPADVELAATNLPQSSPVQSTAALFDMVIKNEFIEHDLDVLFQQGASATAKFASHNNLSAIELAFEQGNVGLSLHLFHNVLMKSLKEAFHGDDFSMVQTLARTCKVFNTEQVVRGPGLLSMPSGVRRNTFCSALPEELRMKITNVRYAMRLLVSSEASIDDLNGLNLPYALLQQFRMLFDLLQGYPAVSEIRPAIQMLILDIFPKSSLEDDFEFSKLLMRFPFVACDSRSPVDTEAIPAPKESDEVQEEDKCTACIVM